MWNKVTSAVQDGIRDLFPAYFALVMATGIISIACHLLEMDFLAFPLFYLNQLFYIILWLLYLSSDHSLSRRACSATFPITAWVAGFLTIIAGTNVLGSQFVILASNQNSRILSSGFWRWRSGFF